MVNENWKTHLVCQMITQQPKFKTPNYQTDYRSLKERENFKPIK